MSASTPIELNATAYIKEYIVVKNPDDNSDAGPYFDDYIYHPVTITNITQRRITVKRQDTGKVDKFKRMNTWDTTGSFDHVDRNHMSRIRSGYKSLITALPDEVDVDEQIKAASGAIKRAERVAKKLKNSFEEEYGVNVITSQTDSPIAKWAAERKGRCLQRVEQYEAELHERITEGHNLDCHQARLLTEYRLKADMFGELAFYIIDSSDTDRNATAMWVLTQMRSCMAHGGWGDETETRMEVLDDARSQADFKLTFELNND